MTKYEKGTLGYLLELAKRDGFDNLSDWNAWKREKRKSKENEIKIEPKLNIIHKEYHLWRWKIKRILIIEKIIEKALNWKTVLDIFDPIIEDILKDANIVNSPEFREILIKQSSLLIEHHAKYIEIHGIDKSLWMTVSEHRKLHNRLRKEGKCNIPSDELAKISRASKCRTDRYRERVNKYYKTDRGMEINRKNQQNIKRKVFSKTLYHNVTIREQISYNIKTGTVTVSVGFAGGHGVKIPIIQID